MPKPWRTQPKVFVHIASYFVSVFDFLLSSPRRRLLRSRFMSSLFLIWSLSPSKQQSGCAGWRYRPNEKSIAGANYLLLCSYIGQWYDPISPTLHVTLHFQMRVSQSIRLLRFLCLHISPGVVGHWTRWISPLPQDVKSFRRNTHLLSSGLFSYKHSYSFIWTI